MAVSSCYQKEENVMNHLPDTMRRGLLVTQQDYKPEHFLQKRLPKSEINEIEHALRKKFPLAKERQVYKKRIKRKGCPRLPFSNTKKRSLGLFNISRNGLLYKDMLPLNQLWKEYIENFLDFKRNGLPEHFEEFSHQLLKADFHGAYMEVIKSVCPNLVGITGIVIFETRNIFKLLGKDNITRSIPKLTCEFKMNVLNYQVTFLGKNVLIRAADRSNKKIRNIKFVEL